MEKILFELLVLDGNETAYMKDESTYRCYQQLIVEVTKIQHNIRYCKNHNCSCHPEYTVKELLKNEDLVEFLDEYINGAVEFLNNWCDDYKPIVSKRIYEDE